MSCGMTSASLEIAGGLDPEPQRRASGKEWKGVRKKCKGVV